jgi:hypothetical protein
MKSGKKNRYKKYVLAAAHIGTRLDGDAQIFADRVFDDVDGCQRALARLALAQEQQAHPEAHHPRCGVVEVRLGSIQEGLHTSAIRYIRDICVGQSVTPSGEP